MLSPSLQAHKTLDKLEELVDRPDDKKVCVCVCVCV